MTIICTAKKCEYNNIISGDTFLICWLCDNCAHVKCAGAGFNGRIGDLISKKVGFTWSCTACREMTDEMRTFMRQTRTGFMEVRKLLTSMNDKFLAVESQFLGLKILSESPKRKIPNNLQLPANGLTTTMLSTPTGANIMEHSPIYLTPSLPPAHTTPSGSSDNLPMQSHSALAAASPDHLFPKALDSTIWPVNTLVHEYLQVSRIWTKVYSESMRRNEKKKEQSVRSNHAERTPPV
ncbi:uncharacterized protein [Drosophila takahashii]|uniref:uncharacterized protein n=1 Tax=Drosophila takahashii TaxID=29030 RepID=UPI0038995359